MTRILRRVRTDLRLDMLNLPRVFYENQGPDFHFIAFSWGNRYGDAVFAVEINLGHRR